MSENLRAVAVPSASMRALHADQEIRVVLADGHDMVRRNLRLLLDAEEGVTVVSEVSDFEAAVRDVRAHLPRVLILDLRLRQGPGAVGIRGLRSDFPDTQIVALTMEASPALAKLALDAGALGYILKEHADRDLVRAMRDASSGESYITPQVAARLQAGWTAADHQHLSGREAKISRVRSPAKR